MMRLGFSCMVLLGLLAAGACGQSTDSSGSNSNWLEPCDTADDCDAGQECWCRVCAAPCADSAACGAASAECLPTAGLGCGDARISDAPLCVAACTSSAQCQAHGASFSCVNGACVVEAPPVTPLAASLAIGAGHSCLTWDGDVYCWGSNLFGQSGHAPSAENDTPPALVPGLSRIRKLSLSAEHSCALADDGAVYCWGKNDFGQVGAPSAPEDTCPDYVLDRPGTYPCQPQPTRVAAVAGAVEIAVSSGKSCAIVAGGALTCWGDVAAVAGWADGVAGAEHVALGPLGACVTLPGNQFSCSYALPDGADALTGVTLLALSTDSDLVLDETGFGCALGSDGAVTCWGDWEKGQRGIGLPFGDGLRPARDGVRQLALGRAHACALVGQGEVECWGRNAEGEIGLPALASSHCDGETCEVAPVPVDGLPPIAAVAAAGSRSCALAEDGSVWCWGGNEWGPGLPQRVPGPWESTNAECRTLGQRIDDQVRQAATFGDRTCVTDLDCAELPLDLPCFHGCATAALNRNGFQAATDVLNDLSARECAESAAASCPNPELACPARTTRAFCNAGTCTLTDDTSNGCTDLCYCLALDAAVPSQAQGECPGYDLWVPVGWTCGSCPNPRTYIVVGNRGDADFLGEATLSFENLESPGIALPAPMLVDLNLAPGMIQAIEVRGLEAGSARVRITAEGDCQPANDAAGSATFLAPNACE